MGKPFIKTPWSCCRLIVMNSKAHKLTKTFCKTQSLKGKTCRTSYARPQHLVEMTTFTSFSALYLVSKVQCGVISFCVILSFINRAKIALNTLVGGTYFKFFITPIISYFWSSETHLQNQNQQHRECYQQHCHLQNYPHPCGMTEQQLQCLWPHQQVPGT